MCETSTTRRFIQKCRVKGCRAIHAFDCPTKQEKKYTKGICGVPGSAQPYIATVIDYAKMPELYCVRHKHQLESTQIKGFKTDHVCDARCTSARGHSCECSCGGANHGKDYL